MTPRGAAIAFAFVLAGAAASAQTVTFQPAAAEDRRLAEETFDAEGAPSGRPISAPLRRRLHERLVLVTTLRRSCPAAFRFTNVTGTALYGMFSFSHSFTRGASETDAEHVSEVPYLPAHQSAVVYFPCGRSVTAPDHGTSLGRTVDEVELRRLLVERQDWGFTTDAAFGPGYSVRTGHDPDAPPAALALAGWAPMRPADADALRARLATSWRGGRAIYLAAARARQVPRVPEGATPDGILGVTSARIDAADGAAWEVAASSAACARASTWARLDAWLASAGAPRGEALADAVLAACAPRRGEHQMIAAVASVRWQIRRAPSYGLAPGSGEREPEDGALAAELAAEEAPPPLDPAAAGRALAAMDDALFERAEVAWRDDPRQAEIWTRAAAATPSTARARTLLDRVGADDPADRVAALTQGLAVGDGWRGATGQWLRALPDAVRARVVDRWVALFGGGRLRAPQAAALVDVLRGDPTFERTLRAADEASQPFDPAAAVAAVPAVAERLAWSLRARCGERDGAGALLDSCLVAVAEAPDALARAAVRPALHAPAVNAVARLIAAGRGNASDSSPATRALAAHGVPAAALARPWCDSAKRWRAAGDERMTRMTLGTLDAILPGSACGAEVRASLDAERRRWKVVRGAVLLGAVALVAFAVRRVQQQRLRALDIDAM